MKNRILFIVLFIVIAVIGLNGTKITAAILGTNDEEELKQPRSSENSGAIYLSPDEISFDPMSIVDKKGSLLVSEFPENNRYYGNSSFDICCIMDSLIKNISIYSEKTEYVKPVDAEIIDNIYAAPNGLYYIEKHPYYNKFNKKRYVDLILDSEDLSIRYINFYDDQQYSVSSDAVQRGIEKFSQMSTDFYSRFIRVYNTLDIRDWFYSEILIEAPEEPTFPDYYLIDTFDESQDPAYNKAILDSHINSACEDVKKAYIESGINNPLHLFLVISSAPSMVNFNDKYFSGQSEYIDNSVYDANINEEAEKTIDITRCVTASMKFTAECMDSEFITNKEFAAYNSRIYMTTASLYNDNKKVIIYNVLTDEIEGFCNFYYNDAW